MHWSCEMIENWICYMTKIMRMGISAIVFERSQRRLYSLRVHNE